MTITANKNMETGMEEAMAMVMDVEMEKKIKVKIEENRLVNNHQTKIMKTKVLTIALIFLTLGTSVSAQRRYSSSEEYGNTLNIGLGIGGYSGYYGYIGHTLPVFDINYEFGVAKNFTLAPFITLYSYSDGNYREYVTPIGVKGTLYLDKFLHAGRNWDFYVAGSLGAALVSTSWYDDYYGDRTYRKSVDPLYLDFHVGTEYHISKKVGMFLDLSTGVSTIGLAIH